MPFFLFTFLFLLYPASILGVRSFQDTQTHAFTFKYVAQLLQSPYLLGAYWLSIKISVITALGGGVFGFLLAFSAIRGGLPRFMRSSLMTFCGVASNFAGVPLAFAFIALLSPPGVLTGWLSSSRIQSLPPWLHAVHLLGPVHRVHVLPVSLDGLDHCAGD